MTSGPLAGIRVLDLSTYIAGPYSCALLGDLGAEVIKIEPPAGDTLRQFPSTLEPEARAFLGNNRNKLGIVLDLKLAEGQKALHRLAESADVLVHNFRSPVPERLGMTYETLHELNPRLIYCALSGYGESGPWRAKAGYDQVLQSLTGISAIQGAPGDPQIVYGSMVDYYAASLIAYSVTAALFHRERTGEGQYVAVSLLGAALAMQSGRYVWADKEPRNIERDLRSGGVTGIHPTKDGFLYISANAPHFWRALCELIDRPELADDPRYDTVRKRSEHDADLLPLLHNALRSRTALEWEEHFGDRVPCGAVRQVDDMFDHPQVVAEELVSTMHHPTVGNYRGVGRPIKMSASPAREPFAAPTLGQHTEEVLRRHGYTEAQLAELKRQKVIPG